MHQRSHYGAASAPKETCFSRLIYETIGQSVNVASSVDDVRTRRALTYCFGTRGGSGVRALKRGDETRVVAALIPTGCVNDEVDACCATCDGQRAGCKFNWATGRTMRQCRSEHRTALSWPELRAALDPAVVAADKTPTVESLFVLPTAMTRCVLFILLVCARGGCCAGASPCAAGTQQAKWPTRT